MAQSGDGSTVLIAVGDELLSGHTQDTNSHRLAGLLYAAGYPVRRIEVVADQPAAIIGAVRRAIGEAGVSRVVVSGGIGPTPDDRTFAAVAEALERPLEENEVALQHITALLRRMFEAGWVVSPEMSEANRRAALVPQGALALPNRRGMSPPIALDLGGDQWLFVLPGIPREFDAIVEEELIPRFFSGRTAPWVREIAYTSVPEAEMYAPMRTLEAEFPDVLVGSYPQTERRRLVIRLRGADEARVEAAAARLRELKPEP
ncbi:MAG: competence/damage-inducible protein A [Candidatus Dormibacteraeota bacterium]|nr:competence/damage-inducible protein A [Candidatus Dormibacteraeota bacterium]MBV9525414.1 competence/damage-inducible protein A [Candidatus Dormibacteraeota bacterium]